MKRCNTCWTITADKSTKCPKCGSNIKYTYTYLCNKCGKVFHNNESICPKCGTKRYYATNDFFTKKNILSQKIKSYSKIVGFIVAIALASFVLLNNASSITRFFYNITGQNQKVNLTQEEKNLENRKEIARLVRNSGSQSVYLGEYIFDPGKELRWDSEDFLNKYITGESRRKYFNNEILKLKVVIFGSHPQRYTVSETSVATPMYLKLFVTDDNIDVKGPVSLEVGENDKRLIIYDPFIKKDRSYYNEQLKVMETRALEYKKEEQTIKENRKTARNAFIKFHYSITNRQLRTAFNILSPNYQSFIRTYDLFAHIYRNTLRSDIIELKPVYEDNSSATLAYKKKVVERVGTGQRVEYWIGKARFIKINGEWRLDSNSQDFASENSKIPTS